VLHFNVECSTPLLYLDYQVGSGDPPPFDTCESFAYFFEKEAARLESIASMNEKWGNLSQAFNNWEEAEQQWVKAIDAWHTVNLHPKKIERIQNAEKKVRECSQRQEEIQKRLNPPPVQPHPTWEAVSVNRESVRISYSNWPSGFRATVKNHANRTVDEIKSNNQSGVVN
jgi:hypothetical protein